jgi:hypothetical protein
MLVLLDSKKTESSAKHVNTNDSAKDIPEPMKENSSLHAIPSFPKSDLAIAVRGRWRSWISFERHAASDV